MVRERDEPAAPEVSASGPRPGLDHVEIDVEIGLANYPLFQTPVNRPTSAAQVSLSFVSVSFRLATFHR